MLKQIALTFNGMEDMDRFMKLMVLIYEAKECLFYLCVDEKSEVIPTASNCIQI